MEEVAFEFHRSVRFGRPSGHGSEDFNCITRPSNPLSLPRNVPALSIRSVLSEEEVAFRFAGRCVFPYGGGGGGGGGGGEEEEPTSVDWRWAPNPKPPLVLFVRRHLKLLAVRKPRHFFGSSFKWASIKMVTHYSLDLLKRYLKSEKRLPKLKGKGRPKVEAEMLAGKEKLLARETIFVDELWQVQAVVGLLKANDWKGAFVVDENLDVYERNVIINNANSRQLTAYVAPPDYKE
ncbi:unnamed protein product [Prunus brigantina]